MTRRQLLTLPGAAAFLRLPAFSQKPYSGTAYREYARCAPDYVRALAQKAYQLRNEEIARLTTPQAVRARQSWARETFWKLAGGEPERTPLAAKTVGSFERDGYRVEKVVYESRPRFHIPANLYIPTRGVPPYPAVLFQMGHSHNGKAYVPYQRCCQGLARLGYVVLAFDPIGQGERIFYPDTSGMHSRLSSPDNEHTVIGKQMLLNGDTCTRLQVWDAVRSLDYLAALPMVDAKRIATTGQSGGGTLSMFLMAVDDRLAASVVCSGNTENVACANFIPPGSTDDAEQNFLGSGPPGFDRWDTVYPFAPKPLLISVSDQDYFGTYSPDYISNGWEEFQKLQKVYEVLGQAEHLAWASSPLPHELAYDTRLKVYNWFERWLKGREQPIEQEPPVTPEEDRTLWVTESGSVVRTFGSLTPFAMNKARAAEKTPADLKTVIGAAEPAGAPLSTLRRAPSREVDLEAVEVQSAAQVWVPGWLFLPRGRASDKPVVLVLYPGGHNQQWSEGELYQSLAVRGYPVCAADLRGIGDLAPEFGHGAPEYAAPHEHEDEYAWAGLIFGRPLVGQRVTDILALVAGCGSHPALRGRRVALAARGKLTVPALFAAALDTRISELYLAGGLVSFRNVVDTEAYDCSFSNFVPSLLRHTDLPDVAAMLGPRRVTLAGTLDATNHTMDSAAVRALYTGSHITIRDKGDWDVDALSNWKG